MLIKYKLMIIKTNGRFVTSLVGVYIFLLISTVECMLLFFRSASPSAPIHRGTSFELDNNLLVVCVDLEGSYCDRCYLIGKNLPPARIIS